MYLKRKQVETTVDMPEVQTSYKNNYDKVIQHINNINYKDELIIHFNKYYVIKNYFWECKTKTGIVSNHSSNYFRCIFGEFWCSNLTSPIIDNGQVLYGLRREMCYYYCICKTGIEVLGMKPQRTTDGKYRYDGISVIELRNSCKKNGLSKYSKLDKLELVKLLMSI
jgi:hypothetical protein